MKTILPAVLFAAFATTSAWAAEERPAAWKKSRLIHKLKKA